MAKSRVSLAETMEVAKIAIEDSSKIVIDRVDSISGSPSSTRKRTKRTLDNSDGSTYWDTLNAASATNPYDYDSIGSSNDWRDRLVTILRGKDDEIHDLQQQLDIAEAEESRLKDMNTILETRLKHLNTTTSYQNSSRANHTSSSSSSTSSAHDSNHRASSSNTSNTSQELQKLQNIISFYEKLTCMSVKPSLDEEHKYICTVKNHVKRTAIKFELGSVMSSEIVFRPIANIHHLPEYLHGEISFEAAMAPVMMGDILQGLYEDTNG